MYTNLKKYDSYVALRGKKIVLKKLICFILGGVFFVETFTKGIDVPYQRPTAGRNSGCRSGRTKFIAVSNNEFNL